MDLLQGKTETFHEVGIEQRQEDSPSGTAGRMKTGKGTKPRAHLIDMLGLTEEEALKLKFICKEKKLALAVLIRELVREGLEQRVRIVINS